jgi:hypothetical protein
MKPLYFLNLVCSLVVSGAWCPSMEGKLKKLCVRARELKESPKIAVEGG